MKKLIEIGRIQKPLDLDAADQLAKKICESRLERRKRAAEKDPRVVEWLARAMERWQSKEFDLDDPFSLDGLLEKRDAKPKFSDCPAFPRSIPADESVKVEWWCYERMKKRPRPGHALSLRLPKDERDEVTESLDLMHAQYLGEHEVDAAFAGVHERFPWMAKLTEKAWKQSLSRARAGGPAGLGPLLILGPPGVGKSSWARAVAEAIGVPRLVVDVGATGGVFDLQGLAKGWGSADKGRLMSTIVSSRTANPIVVLDEIDSGSSRNGLKGGGSMPGLYRVLMGLIEPSTARSWACPYYQIPVDMRHVSWISTCNDFSHIDQPLLDRMTIVEVPKMTRSQLLSFARAQADERFGDDFADTVVDAVDESLGRGSQMTLRHVTRLLDRIETAMSRPLLH